MICKLISSCTCRRKKCDETKPTCIRCADGGFLCQGYPKLPKTPYRPSRGNFGHTVNAGPSSRPHQDQSRNLVTTPNIYVRVLLPILKNGEVFNRIAKCSYTSLKRPSGGGRTQDGLHLGKPNGTHVLSISRSIPLDPLAFNEMIPIIVTQCQLF